MGPSMCLGSASVQNLSFTLVQELSRLLYAPIHLLKILLKCHLQWCSVCDPAKVFLTSKFSYLLFSNPAHQTKTGTANMWETTNCNPSGQIKLSNQSTAGFRLCCIFYQPRHFGPKRFCWAKLTCFEFSSSNLQGYILSTCGAALVTSFTSF